MMDFIDDKKVVSKKEETLKTEVKKVEKATIVDVSKTATKEVAPEKKEAKTEVTKPAVKKATPKKTAKAKADDLKKIEGAGPKAAEALVNAGIDTFTKVAKTDVAKLKEILTAASSRLSHIVTDTWPKQAGLAADGKWDELKELQDRLDGGIEK